MTAPMTRILGGLVFVIAYVLLDWASYLHPMYGLNITPWNPSLALGLVVWFRHGRIVAIPWFVAILAGEALVRDMPGELPMTLGLSAVLTAGYGVMGEALRRRVAGLLLDDRRHLLSWLTVASAGTLAVSALYVSLLRVSGLVPAGAWRDALVRFWIGDFVGIVVTMPFFWLLLAERDSLRALLRHWETAAYLLLAAVLLWVSFGPGGLNEFQYFYLLFLPLVWAAARQGVAGAAVAAFALQAGIIVAVQWVDTVVATVFELQMLGAVLAFVGLFIGVVVDETQRVSDELRQTLRLAAAAEMAAALAHEVSQPLTALCTYGSACQQLLERGDERLLRDTIGRMTTESQRAADVVRRLRDFFRNGATRLERMALGDLIAAAAAQFEAKAKIQGVELLVAPPPPCTLLADRLQLEIVLRNLLANAFEAVAEQPAGRRRVRIHVEQRGAAAVGIHVADSGPGLSSAMTKRLFAAFQSSKASGLGMGLAISRAIAEAHGGRLSIEAADGGDFVLMLPTEGVIDAAN